MIDASQSKWLQGLKDYVEQDREKYRRQVIVSTIVELVISAVGFGIYFLAQISWGLALGGIILVSAVITLLMGIGKGKNTMRSLEKMIGEKCRNEESLAQFDREFMGEPRELVETKTERYVFTEHYMMHQYKRGVEMNRNQLLYYPEVECMNAVSYSNGGGGIAYSCFFYHKNEKKYFLRVNFKKNKTGREFVERLGKMMPGKMLRI